MSRSARFPLTALLAAGTGLTTLGLELLWIRLTGFETGSPLAAFTLIVTCFMLGTAAGAFVLGRLADRTRAPLRLFGLTQLGVGLLGALTWHAAASGGLARPLLLFFDLRPGGAGFLSTLALTYGLVTAAAAFLAGGALPLLVKPIGSLSPLPGRAGMLASAQAAGGAAGALLCGFVLLPEAGLRASLLAMSGLASLTGVAALLAGKPAIVSSDEAPDAARLEAQGEPGDHRWAACAALMASGLSITILEVAWTRLTALSFGSSAQSAGVVLALVIAGLAAGYAAGGRLAVRTARPRRTMLRVLTGAAASILASDLAFGRLPVAVTWLETWLEAGASGWRFSLAGVALLCVPVGLPSLLLGAVYPLALRLLGTRVDPRGREGRRTGMATALSALGNTAGPPIAYFGILSSVGSRGCLLAPAISLCLIALRSAPGRTGRAGGAIRLVPVATLLLIAAAALWLPWDPDLASSGPYLYASYYRSAMERHATSLGAAVRQRGEIVFSQEGPDSLVTVRRSAGGLLSLQVNGKTDASTGGDLKTQGLMAHLPLLVSRSEEPRVMIVGLGSGVTAAAALAHPARQVDVFEISPGVVAAAALFGRTTGDPMSDSRLRLIRGDVRTHLLFGEAPAAPYDVIASQPSNPWIAGQAILFTREFFELASRRLAPDGLMCQWVQGQGLSADDFRSILATFADVFPHVSLWEESNAGGDYLLLGSKQAVLFDGDLLARRMGSPAVAASLERIELRTPADLLSHHVVPDGPLRQLARGGVVQTEDTGTLEFTAPRSLHRETLGEILALLEPARAEPENLVDAGGVLAAELALRSRSAREERQWAAGLGLLAPSLQLDPDLVRAASYLAAGMRGHALEAVRSLSLRSPSHRTPHLMTAHLIMSMPGARTRAELDEVVRELKTAVMLEPHEPYARLFLSRALRASGALSEALLENAAIGQPRPPSADSDRCALFLESGDTASAEAACLEALSRDPGLAVAHANLGVVRSRRGRIRDAEGSYLRALQLDPALADTRYNLAALYERQSRHREGFELLRVLVAPPATGADAATFELAARLALGAGQLAEARRCLVESRARGAASGETLEIERQLVAAEEGR